MTALTHRRVKSAVHLATTSDLLFINEVLNNPQVRPHIWPGDEPVEASQALDLMYVLVEPGMGVMMGEALGGNNYLALTAFLPSVWGPQAVYAMRQGIRKIFTDTDCSRLYGSVMPKNIRASRNMAGMGFKDVALKGNRVTGYIDYLDVLDEEMFKDTCKGGWPGKALFWWNIKAKIEDLPYFVPMDPNAPKFLYDGTEYDFS